MFSTIQLMAEGELDVSPSALVIFGVTGDLMAKKLLPALYELYQQHALPSEFRIFGFARRNWDNNYLHNYAHTTLTNNGIKIDETTWSNFVSMLSYVQSDFADAAGYQRLNDAVVAFETEVQSCVNRLYYLATPASAFDHIIANLKQANLTKTCSTHKQSTLARVIVEKPFGHDLASAQALNALFLQAFSEDQIYRIDHYLGKESVQNILAFRFANSIFEPLWNYHHIDHIQITAAESIGIEGRGKFYEETGALRDFFQNHLLQLLAAVAMEPPKKLTAQEIRNARVEILKQLKPITNVKDQTVRGQYLGYRQEPNVQADSQVETFIAAKLFLASERFKNVPIYLRTGKKLAEKVTDITVEFKPVKNPLFSMERANFFPNTITLRIQPNEGISLRIFTKQPGLGTKIVPSQMDFCYRDAFGGAGNDAYTRLLLDVIIGDQSLFTSTAEIEAAWAFVTPILHSWQKTDQRTMQYEPGSWGPKESNALIEHDGRKWLAEHLIVCPIHETHPTV